MGRPRLPDGHHRRSTSLTLAPETLRRLESLRTIAGEQFLTWSLSSIVDRCVAIAHDEIEAEAFGSGAVMIPMGPKTAHDLGIDTP